VAAALDRPGRLLLIRAQDAIGAVLDCDAGDLAALEVVAESLLRRHEWEVAVALRQITELQAEHKSNATASAGPLTDAVLEPHQRALRLARDAIASRVVALEGYAALVTAAQAAYRDWQDAFRIAKLNDKYLDLVARTAADELAVTEIGDLTEHAGKAAQAFRDTAREVSAAGAALVLPAG